jgi:glycosyltransferase involved in cell wall biosynthesis
MARESGGKIRVLFLIGGMGPAGAERQAGLLLHHLPKDCFQVRLACFRGPAEVFEGLRASGVAVDLLPPPSRFVWPISTLRFLRRTIREHGVDIVHGFLPTQAALAPALRLFDPAIRVITSRRSLDEYVSPRELRLMRLTRRWSTAIVANSKAVAESVRRLEGDPGDRLLVIPNAMPLPPPISPGERSEARSRLGLAEEDFVVAYPAHFRRGKGHDYLPEIARGLVSVVPRARFVLAGDEQSNAEYRRNSEIARAAVAALGLEDYFRFLGMVPNSRPVLAAADVVLNLSDMEGMSNTIMEAMAVGLPLVATEVGGTPELVVDGREGWLVKPRDVGTATKRLADLAADPARRLLMGQAGHARIAGEFGLDRMIGAYAELYERVARRRAPGL